VLMSSAMIERAEHLRAGWLRSLQERRRKSASGCWRRIGAGVEGDGALGGGLRL
jgi:hypothetical protein